MKSLLLNKTVSTEIMTLLEHKNVVDNDKYTATILNILFSNTINNRSIP